MHRYDFPLCPVDGPIEPAIPYSHMACRGAVPNKCGHCDKLFEGECTRFFDQVGHYMHLDHGPCGINGPTDPVTYEDQFVTSKVQVPRKCARCHFLRLDAIRGFYCGKDADKWGDFPRGLDWGSWSPVTVYLSLPLPKVTTRALSQHAMTNDLIAFITEYRRVNPGMSLQEAKNDFTRFREILQSMTESGRKDSIPE